MANPCKLPTIHVLYFICQDNINGRAVQRTDVANNVDMARLKGTVIKCPVQTLETLCKSRNTHSKINNIIISKFIIIVYIMYIVYVQFIV